MPAQAKTTEYPANGSFDRITSRSGFARAFVASGLRPKETKFMVKPHG
jgi:hypothetical protein